MENMEKKEYSLEDYYNLLQKDKEYLKEKVEQLDKAIKVLAPVCLFLKDKYNYKLCIKIDSINEIINSQNNVEEYKNILQVVFGKNLFETNPELNKKNRFNITDLDNLLKSVYGEVGNKSFKLPENYDEFAMFIINCYSIINNNGIYGNTKVKFNKLIDSINSSIVRSLDVRMQIKCNLVFIGDMFQKYIDGVDRNIAIELTEEERTRIVDCLKEDERKFESYKDKKNLSYGDSFLMFCDAFNDYIEELEKEKNDKKFSSKANKFYKKIIGTSMEKLDNSKFPKYSNPNYRTIMRLLLEKTKAELLKNENILDYYTILLMYHSGYFRSEEYLSETVKKTI